MMLGHNYIGTEHLLLGLVHEGQGVAAAVLESLGVSLGAVRQQVIEIIGEGQSAPSGHIPFTPRAKKVLELSPREAMQLGHDYIGTEHLLLGLIREGEGVAAQVLTMLDIDLNRTRRQIIQELTGRDPGDVRRPTGSGRVVPWSVSRESFRLLRLARESAQGLGHELIEPTDLLTALFVSDDPAVTKALRTWEIDLDRVRHRIADLAAKEEEKETRDDTEG